MAAWYVTMIARCIHCFSATNWPQPRIVSLTMNAVAPSMINQLPVAQPSTHIEEITTR